MRLADVRPVRWQRSYPRSKGLGRMKDAEGIVGEALDLADFIKAHPSAVIQGWADKMRKEGGDHPFSWCVAKATFVDNPKAFAAAVHQAAFGKTPMERKKEKKA